MEKNFASSLVDSLSKFPFLKENNVTSCFLPDYYFSYSNTEKVFYVLNLNRIKESGVFPQKLVISPAIEFEVKNLVANANNIICLVGEHQHAFVEVTARFKTELARGGNGTQIRFILNFV